MSRNSIHSGYYFRGRKIREYSENFLHAKNWCYTVVKSRIKWAGDMVRMTDERLPIRAETKKQEGCRKRGRPQLRWEDCVKRDLRMEV